MFEVMKCLYYRTKGNFFLFFLQNVHKLTCMYHTVNYMSAVKNKRFSKWILLQETVHFETVVKLKKIGIYIATAKQLKVLQLRGLYRVLKLSIKPITS